MEMFKKIFESLGIAIIFGLIIGRIMFWIYRDNVYDDMRSKRLYLIENGEYESIDNMRKENSYDDYIYYKDQDKYKIVVGITGEYKNIGKIKELYSNNLKVEEYYVPLNLVLDEQIAYDKKLLEENEEDKVREVVLDILKLYRNDDNIRLVSFN